MDITRQFYYRILFYRFKVLPNVEWWSAETITSALFSIHSCLLYFSTYKVFLLQVHISEQCSFLTSLLCNSMLPTSLLHNKILLPSFLRNTKLCNSLSFIPDPALAKMFLHFFTKCSHDESYLHPSQSRSYPRSRPSHLEQEYFRNNLVHFSTSAGI